MINVTALKQNLKKGIISNLYFFCGEEKFLMDTYTKKITEMAIGDGLMELNYSFYNEDNESFEAFSDDLESYPTMSDKKVIVLKNTSFIKLKDYQKPLENMLSNLPDYAVVIIAETEDAKLKKPLMDIISKRGVAVDFKKQNISDLRAWVTRRLADNGKQINTADAEYLITLCDRALDKLSVECDKLASADTGSVVDKMTIQSLVKVPVEYKIFEMADKLLEGDGEGAYKILNEFKITKVQPVVVFSVIYGQLGDLLMFRLLRDEGQNPGEFLAPNRKWLASSLQKNCTKYSKEKLRRGMNLCAGYDLDVKKGKADGYSAMELMIAEFLSLK